jgi:hypothetical protein
MPLGVGIKFVFLADDPNMPDAKKIKYSLPTVRFQWRANLMEQAIMNFN